LAHVYFCFEKYKIEIVILYLDRVERILILLWSNSNMAKGPTLDENFPTYVENLTWGIATCFHVCQYVYFDNTIRKSLNKN